jgi:histidinol-phosphate aminotransferase
VAAGRDELLAGLRDLAVPVYPTCANFLCAEVGDGRAVASALLRDGVIVRPLQAVDAAGHIRVTVGTPEEHAVFLDALGRALPPR